MSRENYFLLLNLDPGERDPQRIRHVLSRCQDEWTRNLHHPRHGLRWRWCLDHLDEIEQILTNPVLRAEEAADAQRRINARRAQRLTDLDEQLRLKNLKGYLTPAEVKEVCARFAEDVPSDEIHRRIAGLHITVREPLTTTDPAKAPRLDDATMGSIRRGLAQVGQPDLYGFLGAPHSTTAEELLRRTRQRYTELMAVAVRDARNQAEIDLVSDCLHVFADESNRAGYDNALRWQRLERVRERARTAAADGRLRVQVVQELIRTGESEGLADLEVSAALIELAAQHGWPIEVPVRPDVPIRRCGACGELTGDDAGVCPRCGVAFTSGCPRCGTINPSTAIYCRKVGCGFAVGNRPIVEQQVRDAHAALRVGDHDRAGQLLASALTSWPDHAAAQALQQELQNLEQAVGDALEQRHFRTARRLLSSKQKMGYAAPAAWLQQIDKGIAACNDALAHGQNLEQQGEVEAAFAAYSEAVSLCPDHEEARERLLQCPLPAVIHLQATQGDRRIRLSWEKPGSQRALHFRISRREASEAEYRLIGETTDCGLVDHAVEPGRSYWYRVATGGRGSCRAEPGTLGGSASIGARSGSAGASPSQSPLAPGSAGASPSRSPLAPGSAGASPSQSLSTLGPVLALGEVSDLHAQGGNASVRLVWRAPPGASRIAVHRVEGRLAQKDEETLLPPTAEEFIDRGLTNEVMHGYRISCIFLADGQEVATPGITAAATPSRPPALVHDIQGRVGPTGVELSWANQQREAVAVLRASALPGMPINSVCQKAFLSAFGVSLDAGALGLVDARPSRSEPFYLVFTVGPLRAAWCGGVRYLEIDEVSAVAEGERVAIRWRWCGARKVRVRSLTTGHTDTITATGDLTQGAWFALLRDLPPGQNSWQVSCEPEDPAHEFAGPGQTVHLRVARPRSLSWRFIGGKLFRKRRIEVIASCTLADLDRLVLIGKREEIPRSIGDGVPLGQCQPVPHATTFVFDLGGRQGEPAAVFCRLFAEPAEGITILHPPTRETVL